MTMQRLPSVEGSLRLDLDSYVPYLLAVIYNKMSAAASKQYLTTFHVGIVDWRVISMLKIEPNIRAARICQVIGLDKAAVSRSLHQLEEKGFVATTPAPGRGRQKLVRLTPSGDELHDKIYAVAIDRQAHLLRGLASDEVVQLTALLRKLHANVTKLENAA